MNMNISETINMMENHQIKIHQMMVDMGTDEEPSYLLLQKQISTILKGKIQEQKTQNQDLFFEMKYKQHRLEEAEEDRITEEINLLKEELQLKRKIRERLVELRGDVIPTMGVELRSIAYEKGIKESLELDIETLCEKLDIPTAKFKAIIGRTKPIKITLTNVNNRDEKIEFPSICSVSRFIKKSKTAIYYFITKKKVIEYAGKKWIITR